MKGLLIAISGPSGVGKGTIYKNLLKRMDNISVSVSATTRLPRPGEIDGQHYYFVSRDKFASMLSQGEFLEHAETVENLYGTPKTPVLEKVDAGIDIILEIDVKGVRQVKREYPQCLTIFVLPPSMEELEKRLCSRDTESAEQRKKRLELAKSELSDAEWFDYRVVNDNLDDAVNEIINIINTAKVRN